MAFPQVLASQTPTVKVLSPKYLQQYERSGRTADPGMRRCGMAVSGMRGCGALQEMQCLPRRRNFGRSLEEAFLLLKTVRGVRSTKTDTWKIGFPDQARRNAPSNLPAGAGMDPLSAGAGVCHDKKPKSIKVGRSWRAFQILPRVRGILLQQKRKVGRASSGPTVPFPSFQLLGVHHSSTTPIPQNPKPLSPKPRNPEPSASTVKP